MEWSFSLYLCYSWSWILLDSVIDPAFVCPASDYPCLCLLPMCFVNLGLGSWPKFCLSCSSLPVSCQPLLVPVLDSAHDLVSSCPTVTELGLCPYSTLYWSEWTWVHFYLPDTSTPKFKSKAPASWHLRPSIVQAVSVSDSRGAWMWCVQEATLIFSGSASRYMIGILESLIGNHIKTT